MSEAMMDRNQLLQALRRANDVARRALAAGHHPFGAVLVAADGQTVLMEQGNVDAVNHAEAVLAREAAARFDTATLWGCTLVTTVEPCAMCAGTQYWAHIGRLVYGMSEQRLLQKKRSPRCTAISGAGRRADLLANELRVTRRPTD